MNSTSSPHSFPFHYLETTFKSHPAGEGKKIGQVTENSNSLVLGFLYPLGQHKIEKIATEPREQRKCVLNIKLRVFGREIKMEVAALDVEDEVYFADLSKQISLLIMDEDEHLPVTQWHSAPVQGFSRSEINSSSTPSPPLHVQVCVRESKGTGVFIPKCSQPRRRSRHGRHSSSFSSSTRSYRQSDSTSRISQAPQTNNFNPRTKF